MIWSSKSIGFVFYTAKFQGHHVNRLVQQTDKLGGTNVGWFHPYGDHECLHKGSHLSILHRKRVHKLSHYTVAPTVITMICDDTLKLNAQYYLYETSSRHMWNCRLFNSLNRRGQPLQTCFVQQNPPWKSTTFFSDTNSNTFTWLLWTLTFPVSWVLWRNEFAAQWTCLWKCKSTPRPLGNALAVTGSFPELILHTKHVVH